MKISLKLVVCLLPFGLMAQQRQLNLANEQYNEMSYLEATENFERAVKKGADSSIVATKIADAYYHINNSEKSLNWYSYLLRKNKLSKTEHERLIILNLKKGNILNVKKEIVLFESIYGKNDWTENLSNGIEKFHYMNDSMLTSLQNLNFNSEYADFGVSVLNKEQVLLTTNKFHNRTKGVEDVISNDPLYDIYTAKVDGNNQFVDFKPVKGINTTYNEGPACLDQKNGWIYFSADDFSIKRGKSNSIIRVKLYRGKWLNNQISDVQELSVNGVNYSCAHPSLSADGKYLYYASDQNGGYGGTDLYRVTVDENGTLGKPENLGSKVNSPGNEYFPNVKSSVKILFFSSDGYIGNGGLDLYSSEENESGNFENVKNLGKEINSSEDDFSFELEEDLKRGYFSSNRNSGKGKDDVYSFELKERYKLIQTVQGQVLAANSDIPVVNALVLVKNSDGSLVDSTRTNENGNYKLSGDFQNGPKTLFASKDNFEAYSTLLTIPPDKTKTTKDISLNPFVPYVAKGTLIDSDKRKPILGAKVTLKDKKTGEIVTAMTDSKGAFTTPVLSSLSFNDVADIELKIEKPGYITTSRVEQPKLLFEPELLVNNGKPISLTLAAVGTDLNDVLALNPIYFDYRKWNIRDDAAVELDKVVKILKDNPKIKIQLGSHTDARGESEENMVLSEKRAKSSVDYIVSKGISPKRISGKGYGETKLKVSNETIEEVWKYDEKEKLHQLNRRTEFIIVK